MPRKTERPQGSVANLKGERLRALHEAERSDPLGWLASKVPGGKCTWVDAATVAMMALCP